ncbi:MAG: 50S ribosomal protein L9, partial [Bdellovibrio sp. ArHS]
MKVILQKDVKDVGRVGELVNVSEGFARNFLFPRKLAAEATEKRVKEYEHL